MSVRQVIECNGDGCTKQKGEANHWIVSVPATGIDFPHGMVTGLLFDEPV